MYLFFKKNPYYRLHISVLISQALQRRPGESETVTVMKSSAVFAAAFAFFILEKVIHGTQTVKVRVH